MTHSDANFLTRDQLKLKYTAVCVIVRQDWE